MTEPSRIKRMALMRAYIEQHKDVPCADCGKRFPIPCMDFHHEGDKDASLIRNRSTSCRMRKWGKKRIDAELAKCVVLCACCHRLRHV